MTYLHTSSERNSVRLRGNPVTQSISASSVSKSGHSSKGDPSVLAIPSIGTSCAGTGSCAAIWCTNISICEGVTGKYSGGSVRVSEREDRGKNVGIVG